MSVQFEPDFQYLDKTLNRNAQEKYILSIQFALDGFSFLFLDVERKKFTGLETYSFKNMDSDIRFCKTFDSFFAANPWLNGPFKDVFVIYESAKSTLVPEPLFDETEKGLFLKFNHAVSSYEQVVSNYLRNAEAYQVFTLPDCLKFRLDKIFRNKKVLHHSVPLIESIIINYKNQPLDNSIFLNVRKKHIDVLTFNKEGLSFFNSFYAPEPEDMLYYLLFVMDQLSFNPEEVQLILTGNIKRFSAHYDLLSSYVRNILFDIRTQAFDYSYVFDNVPSHFYYTLFNVNVIQV